MSAHVGSACLNPLIICRVVLFFYDALVTDTVVDRGMTNGMTSDEGRVYSEIRREKLSKTIIYLTIACVRFGFEPSTYQMRFRRVTAILID